MEKMCVERGKNQWNPEIEFNIRWNIDFIHFVNWQSNHCKIKLEVFHIVFNKVWKT